VFAKGNTPKLARMYLQPRVGAPIVMFINKSRLFCSHFENEMNFFLKICSAEKLAPAKN